MVSAPEPLQEALKRLAMAIDHLEAAAARRREADLARSSADDELAIMEDDRGRLAAELDGALARNQGLAAANQEVARRLERTSAVVRGVIAEIAQTGSPGGAT